MSKISAIILAAGEGKRMKSHLPKVLHKVCGKEMINHVVNTVKDLGVFQTIVVIGYKGEMVKNAINSEVDTAYQKEQLGTGHAVMQAISSLRKESEEVLILYGDTPLVTASTLSALLDYHRKGDYGATVLTASVENPEGYGRILRNEEDGIVGIVEHKDASPEQRMTKEINSGIYCFKTHYLIDGIKHLRKDNMQGEYYLTDIIEFFRDKGIMVGGYTCQRPEEVVGINTKQQLSTAQKIMNVGNLERLMKEGVIIDDPNSTYIDADVKIGMDTRILPGTFIEGNTSIGEENLIGPGVRVDNCNIGSENQIQFSVLRDSDVGNGCNIGPYAHVRPNSSIKDNVRIGNFVEVKNSNMDNRSKASHLTYIGDGDVGEDVNLGCGIVFVNYDGKGKHRTIIEDKAFIGCNVNLIAPVRIKKGAYVAAGSTITKDVEEYCLAIERGKQKEIKDWVKRKDLAKE